MTDVGSIVWEEAYALGKMLDHSAWQKGDRVLPRGITASDIDAGLEVSLGTFGSVPVFDSRGRMIFVEFSRHQNKWEEVPRGQKLVYQALLISAPHCSVICRHNVTPEDGRKICTRHDVVSFQPMVYDNGIVVGELIESNERWQNFVFQWFNDPVSLRRWLLGKSVQQRSNGNGK